jgi:hypothetical protein
MNEPLLMSSGPLSESGAVPCLVCDSTRTVSFFTLRNVPSQDGLLWASEQEALAAPRGDIELWFCLRCGYIWNHAYDHAKVTFHGYDVSLQHSPLFRQFTESVAERLAKAYDLRNKTVLEIGCGKGHFLRTLCRLGDNQGIGFDPSFVPDSGQDLPGDRITFVQDFYTEKQSSLERDFVCCRHVLDIMSNPKAFLRMVRRGVAVQGGAVHYFESPNDEYTFRNSVIWNVVYEHRSWFVKESLSTLFRLCGFRVLNAEPCFGNEYLGIEAIASEQPTSELRDFPSDLAGLKEYLSAFAVNSQRLVDSWRDRLNDVRKSGLRVVAWGAGARAITFLNTYDTRELIPFVVDINPRRQGLYLPGSGQRVVPPEFLREFNPDVVIISNPTYEQEIKGQASVLGVNPQFLVL